MEARGVLAAERDVERQQRGVVGECEELLERLGVVRGEECEEIRVEIAAVETRVAGQRVAEEEGSTGSEKHGGNRTTRRRRECGS